MNAKVIIMVGLWVLILCVVLFIGNGFLNNRILFDAIEANDYNKARFAIENGAFLEIPRHPIAIPEIVMTNPTPLIVACKAGNENIVAMLLESGANINRTDNCTNETPLLAALQGSKQNRFSLAFLLIKNGADIHMIQSGANSALQESIRVSEEDCEETISEGFMLFRYLMEQEVDTAIPLSWENTITYAVHYGNYNAVHYLLENGYFVVDEPDPLGNTALIVAAKYNRLDIVKLLLNFNASKSCTDNSGKTAFDHAVEKGYTEIEKILSIGDGSVS